MTRDPLTAPLAPPGAATLARVAGNVAGVRRRMAEAARRAGRAPEDVRLVAVTKYASDAEVAALVAAGERCFAENRVPECLARVGAAPRDVAWHFIGHLQRNKAQHAVGPFALVESVDSARLVERLARLVAARREAAGAEAEADDRFLAGPLPILLEFNVAGEAQKHGFAPGAWREALDAVAAAAPLVRCDGLMCMAPHADDAEASRPVFRALRELREAMRAALGDAAALPHLSMGMSGDFEVAIEEGATLVRVGSALFA